MGLDLDVEKVAVVSFTARSRSRRDNDSSQPYVEPIGQAARDGNGLLGETQSNPYPGRNIFFP